MTIRSRIKQSSSEEGDMQAPVSADPGFIIECDSCFTNLTRSVRIRCADPVCESSSIDICADCFRQGKEFGRHKAGHPYRVIEKHYTPIFDEDWTADEEVNLLDGLIMHGMGNWLAVAEFMGSRTKKDVEEHYLKYWRGSKNWPLPEEPMEFETTQEEMLNRKRDRLKRLTINPPLPPPPVQNSGPTSHEIAGFMPGRLEFEHELDNEAEDLVKDLEFGIVRAYGGDEQIQDPADAAKLAAAVEARREAANVLSRATPNGHMHSSPASDVKDEDLKDELPQIPDAVETKESIETKLALLRAYSARIDKRLQAKTLIFQRGLLEFRKMQAADKRRSKEERDFLTRFKVFAKMQTAQDNEDFLDGLMYEQLLRKRITELQELRRLGLTSLAEAETYEKARQYRNAERAEILQRGLVRNGDSLKRAGSVTDDRFKSTALARRGGPLTFGTSASLNLLSSEEQELCRQIRVNPQSYIVIKATIVRESQKYGNELSRKQARDLLKCDVNKAGKVWDFLVRNGVIKAPMEPPVSAISLPDGFPQLNGIVGISAVNGYVVRGPDSDI
ncbi:related to ADA2-General transcriptional adaptor or co-activator [Serendipita indica DSM 11827]|uniref:Transcriptional adapter 2 n=1 Tax=Serendipita indica (strain DSM 11827) TaxID=1109443 RepID=G4TTT9_SERID|nr:related to ADA2-General transcriptional adaptor or co-activator [Serendipita indica DSM 11827]